MLLCFFSKVTGQTNLLEKRISLPEQEYRLKNILNLLFNEFAVNLSYSDKEIPLDLLIYFNQKEDKLETVLDQLSQQAGLEYSIRNEIIILKVKKPLKKYIVSGFIKDNDSGETLPYANIIVSGKPTGTVSNKFGFYSITLTEGPQTLIYAYMGYNSLNKTFNLNENITLNIDLFSKTENLEEIIIKPEQTDLLSYERRLSSLDVLKIKEIPASLGEADVLRSCQTLPGVTSVVEAGGGYFVRGGAWDQNLMLLDEAIVYNGAHLEGFFSVFNPDVLKDIKFYKGGMPANYGGRIASVLDITQKEGNMKSYHVNGGLGLIASKLMVEGPLIKDKASFIVAVRRSYMDLFFKYLPDEDLKDTKYFFYDLNTKLNFIINPKNRLYVSLYSGNDHLEDDSYFQQYGNLTTTLRWNHIFGNRLFSNTSFIYSDYEMEEGDAGTEWAWKNVVGIDHYEFKNNFTFFAANHKIDFGVNLQYLTFNPGDRIPITDSSLAIKIKIPEQHSLESALYVNDNIKLSPKIELMAGLRFSGYLYLGPEDVFIYDPAFPKDEATITDTIHYGQNKVIKPYSNFEPRLSVKFNLTDNHVLKLTYNRMAQYINRISENSIALPYDMYKPVNKYIKPVISDQVAIGYFASLKKNIYDLSIEFYYKKMNNIIEIRPGSDIHLNRTLDADLLQGEGKAYGIETMLSKTTEKLSASVSYTYSRSLKKISGENKQETLNFGKYYPAHYDIPHQFKLTAQYKLNNKWSFNADFVYMTGRPVSFPDGQYIYAETLVPYYSGINQHRLPDYHRLNLGATRYSIQKPKHKWKGYWNFSLYNVYARKNAYSIYLRRIPGTRYTEAVRYTIIGSVVPTLSYNFEF